MKQTENEAYGALDFVDKSHVTQLQSLFEQLPRRKYE